MRIPFDYLTKTTHLDRFAATQTYGSKVRHIRVRFRSLAYISRFHVPGGTFRDDTTLRVSVAGVVHAAESRSLRQVPSPDLILLKVGLPASTI
jgi:hypothetical protein